MFDIRIVKTGNDCVCKLFQLLFGKRQRGNYLVKNRLHHKALDIRILHGLQHDIIACQIRSKYKGSVRAIQNTNLALLVWFLVVSKDNRQSCIRKRELLTDILIALDNPKGKRLARHQNSILISQIRPNGLYLVPRITGNNPVHQRRGKNTRLVHPDSKSFLQSPEPDKLHHTFLQHNTVIINQLHRQHNKSLFLIAMEKPVSLIQKFRQLARKSFRRL